MPNYGACLIGKYPRSDSTWDAIKKSQAEPNEKNRAALEEAYETDSRALIRLQKEQGLSLIVDGSMDWDDLLKPYTESLDGVKVGGIERWYETNTFYYTPIINGKIQNGEPILPHHLRLQDLNSTQRPWAATMISPYTFSRLAKNHYYRSQDEMMFDVAEVLATDIKALAEKGCSHLHILDPEPAVRESLGLHLNEDEIQQWKEALRTLFKQTNLQSGLFLSYGNASRLLHELDEFPVDYLGFDLARTPPESLTENGTSKGLMLGGLYSDISLREDLLEEEPAKIAALARKIVSSRAPSQKIYLTPNHELSTVTSRREADNRVTNLGRALKILEGSN